MELITVALLLLRLCNSQSPMVKGDYRFDHPTLPNDFKDVILSSDSFWEHFQYHTLSEFEEKWIRSTVEISSQNGGSTSKAFPGTWKWEEAYLVPGFKGDFSLVLGSSDLRSCIARKLENPLSMTDNPILVVQYEVKLQKMLECGGAYLKLLTSHIDNLNEFHYNDENVQLVFGPDICSHQTNEIILSLRRTNSKTGKSEEKRLNDSPVSHLDSPLSKLYTLIINGDTQEFEMRVNGNVVKAGNLLNSETFNPPLSLPKVIKDPSDKKPLDWDDRLMIPDPSMKKPADWDEQEPETILDPYHSKPMEWDENIPKYIPDLASKQPKWWNEQKDGVWIPPTIINPSCYTPKGCGKWKQKTIKNPKYRGPWKAPMIKNPNYQGKWIQKEIANPDYYEDITPGKLEQPIGYVAFDLWSTVSDILFDNIYIGHSIKEAELLGNKTFLPKLNLEMKELKLDEHVFSDEHLIASPPHELPSKNLFDIAVNYITDWFMGLDDLVKGFIIGIFMMIVLVVTVFVVIKGLVWSSELAPPKNHKTRSNTSTGESSGTNSESTTRKRVQAT